MGAEAAAKQVAVPLVGSFRLLICALTVSERVQTGWRTGITAGTGQLFGPAWGVEISRYFTWFEGEEAA